MRTLQEKAKTTEEIWVFHKSLTNVEWVRLEDAQKEIDKLKLWIFGLYKKADHLSHEDERQSCAYILRDVFGVETEEGMFGEVFLTEKSQKELEGLLK